MKENEKHGSNEQPAPEKPAKELTERQIQQRRKMIVFPLMLLAFSAIMWLIFAPSGGEETTEQAGLNTSLPTPEQSGIVADKRDAYVQQEMKAKQEAKMRSLEDFAFSLGEDSESEIADYNGTFDEVTTKAKRSAGFTMTGSATQVIAQAGQTTTVQIALERLVSKVAVQATTDSKFASAYPGRVRIASATVSRAASSVFYFDVGTSHSGGTQNREYSGETMPLSAAQTFSHTQAAKEQSGKYANLFYIYGNEDDKAAESVLLTLEGIYDHDGDFGTTDDQMPVSYEIELAGDSGKAINRNTYRRVTVNISGLTGADVAVTITPADWEGPFNQDVNIGM